MSRRMFCLCAVLAALAGLAISLAQPEIFAQNQPRAEGKRAPAAIRFAEEGEARLRVVEGTVSTLGANDALKAFRMLALAKFDDNSNQSADVTSDDKGAYRIEVGKRVSQLRIYAYGEFIIPDSWSTVPLATLKFEKAETWDLKVRPNVPVELKGKVLIAGSNKPAGLCNVSLAPLDVRRDGTMRVFDAPYQTRADDEGNYVFTVPSGYYRLWAVWADRSVKEWPQYIGINRKIDLFTDAKHDLSVSIGRILKGKVTDARDGKGIAARIDLFTNAFLRQLNNSSSDGDIPDDEGPNGEPIVWPVGTFKFRVYNVDTDDFAAVIKPRSTDAVLRVISGLKMADLEGKELDWKLYSDDQIIFDVRVQTGDLKLPVNNLDVSMEATRLEDEKLAHLRSAFAFTGVTDDNGSARFLGLMPGTYSIYVDQGTKLIGQAEVTSEKRQRKHFDYVIPFGTGTLKYPDGSLCKAAMCQIDIEDPTRGKLGPFFRDVFDNKKLAEEGRAMLPLTIKGATFKLKFFANEPGKPIPDEWTPDKFPLATDEISFQIDAEKAYTFDLNLKAVKKDAPPPEETGPMKPGEFWYRMENEKGIPEGYVRVEVKPTDGRGQSVDWEMKIAFDGGTYEENRALEVDKDRRLVRAYYKMGEYTIADAKRDGAKLVGKAIKKRGEQPSDVSVELSDDACSGMSFLLAATLPLKDGATWTRKELDESKAFAEGGEVTFRVSKDTIDWEGKALNCWRVGLTNATNEKRNMTLWVSNAREIVRVDWGGERQVLATETTKHLFKPKPPAMKETAKSSKEWLELECDFEGVSAQTLYDHFTKPELLTKWWPPEAEIEMKVGGKYRAIWKQQNWSLEGTVKEFEEGKKFVFTWRWNSTPADSPTLEVHVTFEPVEASGDQKAGARLVIRHGPNAADEKGQEGRKGYMAGWNQFVAKLKEVVK